MRTLSFIGILLLVSQHQMAFAQTSELPTRFPPSTSALLHTDQQDTLADLSFYTELLPHYEFLVTHTDTGDVSFVIWTGDTDMVYCNLGPHGEGLQLNVVAFDVNGGGLDALVYWSTEFSFACYSGGASYVDSGLVIWDLKNKTKLAEFTYYSSRYSYDETYEEHIDSVTGEVTLTVIDLTEESTETRYSVLVERKHIRISIPVKNEEGEESYTDVDYYLDKNGFSIKSKTP